MNLFKSPQYIQQERKVPIRTKLIWMGLKDNNHQFFEYLLSFTFPQHMDQATAIVAELCDICREVCRINPVFVPSGVHAYMETSMDSLKKIALFLYPRFAIAYRYEILYIENVSFVLHNNQSTNPRETESDTCGTFGAAAPGAYAESEILTSA
ncbi:hypothetical protein HID58_030306 [Brassica napus]|uniref:Uncharacterized protein n=1 Tax=Brassica napus TaxID=3708 RepID=A0ABQ8CFM0_BRANA|nr:hypothetical protein HID58_030306 [Brassica napus]